MSNEDLTNYSNSNICIYCENECINKVLDHDHFTGKYRRLGYRECNSLARRP